VGRLHADSTPLVDEDNSVRLGDALCGRCGCCCGSALEDSQKRSGRFITLEVICSAAVCAFDRTGTGTDRNKSNTDATRDLWKISVSLSAGYVIAMAVGRLTPLLDKQWKEAPILSLASYGQLVFARRQLPQIHSSLQPRDVILDLRFTLRSNL
jgi:hypothetical protein